MNKKRILFAIIMILLISAMLIKCNSKRDSHNVFVLFLVDTLRYDTFCEIAGKGYDDSGFALLLDKNGKIFDKAFTTSPWTLPSFYSIFTSIPAYQLPAITRGKPAELVFFTDVLRKNKIYTLGIGSSPYFNPFFGFDRHFDTFKNIRKDSGELEYSKKVAPDLFFSSLASAREIRQSVIEIIDNNALEGDLFLFIHFIDPHIPYLPSGKSIEDFLEMDEIQEFFKPNNLANLREISPDFSSGTKEEIERLYYECVRDVDREIGVIVNHIEKSFNKSRICYLLSSDHGEEFWEHGGFEHGHSFYNEVVHIPFLITDHELQQKNAFDLTCIGGIVFKFFAIPQKENLNNEIIISNNLYGKPGVAVLDYPKKFICHDITGLFDLETDSSEKYPLKDNELISGFLKAARRILDHTESQEFSDIDNNLQEELKSLGYIQ